MTSNHRTAGKPSERRAGLRARSLAVALGAWLAATPLVAGAEDLAGAVRAAFSHDPLYAAAVAQSRGSDAKRAQAAALWRPQAGLAIGGGIGGAQNSMRGASFSGPGFPDTTGAAFRTSIDYGPYMRWALSAQLPIYSAERSASERQLLAQAQIGEARRELAAQDLRMRVVQAYFDVLSAEDALAVLARQREAVTRAFDEAKERFDAGDTPITELRDAQSRRDALAAQQLGAQAELRLRRAALEDTIGRPAGTLERPAGVLRTAMPPASRPASPSTLEAWTERATTGSPMRRLFDLGEAIAGEEVAKLRGWTAPTVDLVARVSDERLRGDGPYGDARIASSAQAIGVQVNVPLYTGGMRDAQRDEAVAALERVRAENADGLRTIRRQVLGAWEGVTTGAARIAALEQSLASARTRLEATELGREAGARTTLDVLNAQAELFGAERTLLQARYGLLIDRARLAAAAGDLDDVTIALMRGAPAQ